MYLVEADRLERSVAESEALEAAIEEWQDFPESTLSHHGERCCRIAREWLIAMDHARQPAGEKLAGPRWIRQRVTWGPSRWPVYFCEAVSAKTLDCGALAALATVAFRARGLTCYTAQLIQQYTAGDSAHWYRAWESAHAPAHWIRGDLVYHEGSAVVVGDEVRLWDATAASWLNPKQVSGYGGVLALRVVAPDVHALTHLMWGAQRIPTNRWTPMYTPSV